MVKILATFLVFLILPAHLCALTLSAERRPAAPGNEATVGVYVTEASHLGHLTFVLHYDWARLELLEVATTVDSAEAIAAVRPEALPDDSGELALSLVAAGGIDGARQVAELTFAVADTVPASLELTFSEARASATNLHPLDMEVRDGGLSTVTAVAETEQALPQQTALLPNYPNPFNATTVIPFHLARPGEVRLRIYNVMGQEVRDLDLGEMAAGVYTGASALCWDGRDHRGQEAGSGVYFLRLEARPTVMTQKSLLLR